MEDLAAMAVLDGGPDDLAELVTQLRAEVMALRQEVNGLRRENLQLRQEAAYWRSQHARALKRHQELEQRVRELEAKNRQLRQQAFGRRSEQSGTGTADTLLDELNDEGKGKQRKRGQRKERPSQPRTAVAVHEGNDREAVDAKADAALRRHVQTMHQQAETEVAEPNQRAPCRKVLTSLLEHWPGLTLLVDDPRIPLDNNACERQLRGPVVGRKNYYGSGAVWSGRLAALLFSLLATLERCQINPRDWLNQYLQACAAAGGRPPPDLEDWFPWRYAGEPTAKT